MSKLTQLGNKVALPASPEDAVLELISIKTRHVRDCCVRFSIPEFTSLCPITGQPDFARFYIDYIPFNNLIESKSLKLFMGSFRNHGAFHEDVTANIGNRLWDELKPQWIRVTALWYPRGGIPIDVFFERGSKSSTPVPEIKLDLFTGR